MRIVAGTARGRSLLGPRKDTIRPTADRVRESIFNILGQWMDGLAVLDLYAGTGALALEALSRGAARAVLVDSDREAVSLCRANAEALGFQDRVTVLPLAVSRGCEQLGRRGEKFDLVFADPPYAAEALTSVSELVQANGLLAPTGTLVVEHERHEAAPERIGALTRVDARAFGGTSVSFFRFLDPSQGPEHS